MIKKSTLTIAVVLIIATSLLFGFAYDGIVSAIERAEHPRAFAEFVTAAREEKNQMFIPESLIFAVIKTESDFDPDAVSPMGAAGLMQLMPDTFRDISDNFLGERLPDEMISDPETNIRYGVFYLSWLYYSKFGNWDTVLAAYNAGIGNVYDWLDDPEFSDDGVTLKYIPIAETRAYVSRVRAAQETYERLYNT